MASAGSISREGSPLKSSVARGASHGPNVSIWYGPPSGRFRSPLNELFLAAAPLPQREEVERTDEQLQRRVELHLVSALDAGQPLASTKAAAAAASSPALQYAVVDYRCPTCSGVFPVEDSAAARASTCVRECSGCVECPRCGGPASALCSRTMEAWLMCPACDWRTPRYPSAAALNIAVGELSMAPTNLKAVFAELKKKLAASDESLTHFSSTAFSKMGSSEGGDGNSGTREARIASLDKTLEDCRRRHFSISVLNQPVDTPKGPGATLTSQESSAVRFQDLVISVNNPSSSQLAAQRNATIFALSSLSRAPSPLITPSGGDKDPGCRTRPLKKMLLVPRVSVCHQKDPARSRHSAPSWLPHVFPAETHLNDVLTESSVQLSVVSGRGSRTTILTASAARWLPVLSVAPCALPPPTEPTDGSSQTKRYFFWLSNINDHVSIRVTRLAPRARRSRGGVVNYSLSGELIDPPPSSPTDAPTLWTGITLDPLSQDAFAKQRDHVDATKLLAIAESSVGIDECGHRLLFYADVPASNATNILSLDIEVELQVVATSAGGGAVPRKEPSISLSASSASSFALSASSACSVVRYVAYVLIEE